MIIEFKIKNFRSILDQQTFSLVGSAGSELNQNTFNLDSDDSLKILRSSVIYGANASGKSNLLNAMLFMQYFIVMHAKESVPGDEILVEPFSFDNNSREEPSEFEITFAINGVRYQYGFVVDKLRVYEEWLFVYQTNRAQQWFNRVYNKDTEKYSWKFSKYFKHKKQVIDLTRPDVLFLSSAVKLNNEQLSPIFSWFQKELLFIDLINGRGLNYKKSIDYVKNENGKRWILKFMKAADPSIIDIVLDMKRITEDDLPSFPDKMPKEVQDYFKKELMDKESPKISLIHSSGLPLDFSDESDGTRKLLGFAGNWIDALENGKALIVDELNNSLHPLVIKFLIDLINNPEKNKKNAQLIFTTHDTSLLDNEIFRRDQVWFVEKDKKNSSQIYPLLNFSPRKKEAIGRGYLQGRYGALPYIGKWGF